MIKTITILFLTFFLTYSLYAKENYSEMSTQELLSIVGYVQSKDVQDFKAELALRVPTMSSTEKRIYNEKKDKLKK